MEKYLIKTDESGSSDASVAHTTLDLNAWADSLSRNHQAGCPEVQISSVLNVDSKTQQQPASIKNERDRREETISTAVPLSKSSSACHKSDSKRSSIPRPSTSARRSVGAEQCSSLKPSADNVGACDNSASSTTKTCGSSGRALKENGVKPVELKPKASNTVRSFFETSQGSNKSSISSSGLPRTPPGLRKGQLSLSCLKGSSHPAPSVKSAGQRQKDRSINSPEKKPAHRNIMAAPLPGSSVEQHVGFSQPPQEPASGELKKKERKSLF